MVKDREFVFQPQTPPRSPLETLTAQFYDWERRGRGWQVWPEPVRLEPPFRTFFFHGLSSEPVLDDGRRSGLVGSLVQRLSDWLAPAGSPTTAEPRSDAEEEDDPLPATDGSAEPLVEFQVALPPGFKISRDLSEQLLFSLSHCHRPLSFELIGLADEIVVQLTCRQRDRTALQRQMAAYFPEAVIAEETDFLNREWRAAESFEPVIVDFGLSQEFMVPLKTVRNFDHDPLIGLAGALSELEEGEIGVMQILFEPASHPWAESIFRAVTDDEGKAFFIDAPQLVAQTKEKIERPLYAAIIRVAAQSPHPRRAWQIAQGLASGLASLDNPHANELIPLNNEDYDDESHSLDLLRRSSHRSGMLLNSDELISLMHLPSASVRSPKLRRDQKKTKAAPDLALGHELRLGQNLHNGQTMPVTLDASQRIRHMHVIGASGTGKSTFLLNLILQDIENGEGVAVLDPHGDLIDQLLERIPESRHKDVVLLDPSDEDYPIGFNILSAHSELEKQLLASDLASVFRRLSTSWGDQMTSVLGNAILAFLESERGGTLADLRRFLVEREFREDFLSTVKDREVVYYWRKEFPLLTGKPQAPLLTRLDIFLRPKLIRHMVAQRENRLDFARIMNQGQIFLAKLSQGAIGEENAYLLGTLIVSKFHQMALSRQELQETGRRNFYLYIDEFHNFITPSMASILSGARKYHLGLILAHQELRQLGSRDMEVTSAVLANPYSRVCFRLGDEDARKLQDGFSFFDARDLQNLGTGEAICRIERAEYDFNLKTSPLAEVEAESARTLKDRIVALSRERYATPRQTVEEELAKHWAKATEATPQKVKPAEPKVEGFPEREATPRSKVPTVEKAAPEPSGASPVEESPDETPPPITRAKARPTPIPPPEPPSPGRGGKQHKYIQQLIKQWAEGMGWRAEIEKTILEGGGCVDVALEKGSVSIACEISVTTGIEQELGNIDKCLKAGYGYVVALSPELKQVERIKNAYGKRAKGETVENVRFLTVEELLAFVEELEAKAAGHESKVKGYKVNVRYRAVDEEEKKAKKQTLSQVILDSLKKMKK